MRTGVLILGCGIAGAAAALRLAEDRQRQIVVVTRTDDPEESNSSWAQGGIVARGTDDSAELLQEDILRAGAGLSWPPAAELLAEAGPPLLRELLIDPPRPEFDRNADGGIDFGLEAAHSRRRIVHVGDQTGRAIMQAMLARLRAIPNVHLLTRHTAVDLVTFPHHARDPLAVYEPLACHGAYLLDQATQRVEPVIAASTILATGGLGQIFLNTSNPPGARGDGLAMAYRAGARVVNAEYVQFHPTTLHVAGVTKFLISEAVRGEGGVLLNLRGERFLERYAPDGMELAPRDVVARATYWELLAHDETHVLLDIASHKPADYIRKRFPAIHARCLEHHLDITERSIPVVPAAHYCCGGVLVDVAGQSSLPGLYAVGEVACSGVHGANRLASTSLLEGLVWGDRAACHIRDEGPAEPLDEEQVPPWDVSRLRYDPDPALIQGDMQTIRNVMWHYVGLVRAGYRLNRALRELSTLSLAIEDFYRRARLTDGLVGLRNAVQVAILVTRAARTNRVSRGAHFREDVNVDEADRTF